MRPWRALVAVAGLASCTAPRPPVSAPAAAPDLAAVLAPEVPRPGLVAPLTGLLRGDRSDLLLTLGDETVRCQVSVAPGRSTATCDDIVEEAASVPDLVRQLHRGDWRRRLMQARVEDPVRFSERTGFRLDPVDPGSENNPYPPPEVAHYLGDPMRWTRFAVGERGETVRATFKVTPLDAFVVGTEPLETIEAGSLFVLAQRLRARQAELIAQRDAHAIHVGDHLRMESLLRQVEPTPSGHWSAQGLTVGQTTLRQINPVEFVLRPRPAGAPQWDPSGQTIALVATERAAGHQGPGGASLASVVVQATVFMTRGSDSDPLDCAFHDEWLAGRPTPLRREEPTAADECRWRWSDSSHRLDFVLATTHSLVTLTWQPDRFARTEHVMSAMMWRPRPHRTIRLEE